MFHVYVCCTYVGDAAIIANAWIIGGANHKGHLPVLPKKRYPPVPSSGKIGSSKYSVASMIGAAFDTPALLCSLVPVSLGTR